MIARTLFDDEHELFRESVRSFIRSELVPEYPTWEKEGIVPREVWKKAAEIGILCPTVPEEYGGLGASFLHSVVVTEEMAHAGLWAPTFYLQSDIVAPYLIHTGTEAQKHKYLPGMISGDIVAAVGMSEPHSGSDLAGIRTVAKRDGDDYVVNGQKVFITSGHSADLVVLAVKTDPSQRAKGVSLLLVETDSDGFERGRKLEKIGCKAQDTSELFFSDLRVPVENLLGEAGKGFAVLMKELAQERLVQAVRAIATCETALDQTVEYTSERELFGRTLADFQNTQFTLAQLSAEIAAQRVYLDRCIELHLDDELDGVEAAKLKMTTTQLQGRVTDECLQLHGGWGYMTEYPISRAFVDSRMARVGGGAIEVMKQIVARDMFAAKAKTTP